MKKTLREIYNKGIRRVIVKDANTGERQVMILENPIYRFCLHTKDETRWVLPVFEPTVIRKNEGWLIIAPIVSRRIIEGMWC